MKDVSIWFKLLFILFAQVIFPCTLLGTGEPWTLMKTISVTEYLNYESGMFSSLFLEIWKSDDQEFQLLSIWSLISGDCQICCPWLLLGCGVGSLIWIISYILLHGLVYSSEESMEFQNVKWAINCYSQLMKITAFKWCLDLSYATLFEIYIFVMLNKWNCPWNVQENSQKVGVWGFLVMTWKPQIFL